MNLINIINNDGVLVVNSREVAENFSRKHERILKEIEYIKKQIGETENWKRFFIESIYEDQNDKQIYKEYLLTHDGFNLLVTNFSDNTDLKWKLQYMEAFNKIEDTLINNKPKCIEDLIIMQAQILKDIRLQLKETKEQTAIIFEKTEQLRHRVNNLDMTEIKGTPRKRLSDMVRKYAFDNGILYSEAWHRFRSNFNKAYGTNIEQRRENYLSKNSLKKLSFPEYLERVELIEDAIRVADKMLNSV